jgi:hypothetical protein
VTLPTTSKAVRVLSAKPSIENGRLVRVSVSQIRSFLDCELKWWLDKRAKLERKPPSKGQVMGDQAHKRIEHYLLTGEDVRGPLERAGAAMLEPFVAHAPFNGGALMVEAALSDPTIYTPGGVEIVGYADLILPPGYLHPGPVVIDHKFKKDLEAYAEKPEQLREDEQAIVYSEWCFRRWPGTKSVLFAHHNHQTQGPRVAYPVQVVLEREYVLDRFEKICSLIDGPMTRTAASVSSEDVRFAREETCSKFGGCDFLLSCPNAPARRFARIVSPSVPRSVIYAKEDPKMGLVDAVRKQMQLNTPTNTPAAPSPTPAAPSPTPAAPSPTPAAPSPALVRVPIAQATPGGLYLLPSGSVARLEVITPTGAFASKPDGSPVRLDLTVEVIDMSHDNVSRAQFGLAPLGAPAAPSPEPAKRRMLIVDAPTATSDEPGAGSAVAPPDQPPAARNPEDLASRVAALSASTSTAPADAPKRRGRPPGSGKKASASTNPASTLTPITAPTLTSSAESVAGAALPAFFSGLVLCVDCTPNAGARDLTGYVADLAASVARSANVPDVRFAPKDNPLAFSAWRGALAAAARESPPTGLCAIYSSDLSEPVIDALAGIASLVIRGRK